MTNPQVGIIMGSKSDLPTMLQAAELLEKLKVSYELEIISAHRTPERMARYAQEAQSRGLTCVIAGAGGAAHLPGMTAAHTMLPVIGVPILSRNSLNGWDSLLSIAQMPKGVPVATVAVDAAVNAGILAAQIVATSDSKVAEALASYRNSQSSKVENSASELAALRKQEDFSLDKVKHWLSMS